MKQTFMTTWHPAMLFQDKPKTIRSFLLHVEKAVKIAEGKPADRYPFVHYNPSATVARKLLRSWEEFAVDIETTSVKDTTMQSIAAGHGDQVLVWSTQDPRAPARLKPLMEALADPSKTKVFQNADFDVGVLIGNGWTIPLDTIWDTMLEHQMRFPDEPVNLSFLASMATDIEAWKHLRSGEPEKLLFYNALDAWTTDTIYMTAPDRDLVTPSMERYIERRMPTLWKTIIPLNRAGVRLDTVAQQQMKGEWSAKAKTWRARIIRHCEQMGVDPVLGWKGGKKSGDWTANVSNKRIKELLYGKLGLPEMEDPKTGSVSVGANALEKLEDLDSSGTVALLLERSRFKDVETPIKIKADKDGLVRTRYVFGGDEKHDDLEVGKESPASGRLASRDPNLQNIREWIRRIFISRFRGGWLVKSDYSQIELRIIGLLSRDPELLKAAETDAHLYLMWLVDRETDLHGLHQNGFQWLLDHKDDPVVKAARHEQKRVNFGWPYRMGAKKVENTYGVPFPRAKAGLDGLNRRFWRVVDWWDSLVAEVKDTAKGTGWGYLTNPFGRVRRLFPEDVPKMCAFKPSSTAADILYDAMDELTPRLAKLNSILCLTVHDEIVVDTRHPKRVVPLIKEVMERPIEQLDGAVIPVDIKVGRNWAEQTPENPDGMISFSQWLRRN